MRSHMLLLANDRELPMSERVWGTGGWYPPEQREALDWLTLARLCGWSVSIARHVAGGFAGELAGGSRWLVLACDADELGDAAVDWIASRLQADAVLFVARAAAPGSALARLAGAAASAQRCTGRSLNWQGPGAPRTWVLRCEISGGLDLSGGATPWITLDGAALVSAKQIGAGIAVTLGFHPSAARDLEGSVTAALRHLLICGALQPIVWLDFERTAVLRMDDPGGAQNVHLRNWHYPKLTEPAWRGIAGELGRREARMSVAYTAGWVDDGDPARGELFVSGRPAPRAAGRVHPSPLVRYVERAAPGTVHDYESEYRGILALRRAGAGDVELHGYTHMDPDSARWASAPDRYDRVDGFRELGANAQATIAARSPEEHPLALGMRAMREHFDTTPTTLVCPGEQWTNEALGRALELDLQMVGSYYLALRHDGRFCWSVHVCAPYLDAPAAAWFDSGLPVVGYFHDRDLALQGCAWLAQCLERWQEAGARRFIDFRELAALLARRLDLAGEAATLRLCVDPGNAPDPPRPFALMLRAPQRELPARIEIDCRGMRSTSTVEPLADGCGRFIVAA